MNCRKVTGRGFVSERTTSSNLVANTELLEIPHEQPTLTDDSHHRLDITAESSQYTSLDQRTPYENHVYDIIQPSKRTTIGDNYNQINTGQDLNLNIWVIFNPRYSLLKIEDLKTVSRNFETSKYVLMGAPVCFWNSRVCLVSRHYLASLIPDWQTRSDDQA